MKILDLKLGIHKYLPLHLSSSHQEFAPHGSLHFPGSFDQKITPGNIKEAHHSNDP